MTTTSTDENGNLVVNDGISLRTVPGPERTNIEFTPDGQQTAIPGSKPLAFQAEDLRFAADLSHRKTSDWEIPRVSAFTAQTCTCDGFPSVPCAVHKPLGLHPPRVAERLGRIIEDMERHLFTPGEPDSVPRHRAEQAVSFRPATVEYGIRYFSPVPSEDVDEEGQIGTYANYIERNRIFSVYARQGLRIEKVFRTVTDWREEEGS